METVEAVLPGWRGDPVMIKGLTKALEVWVWMQVVFTILGLLATGAGFWACWQAIRYTAWLFGLM